MVDQQLVDVGGYRLALRRAGVGRPPVVLEAGMGQGASSWEALLEAVAAFTQVVAYDRAGVGASEAAPTPRSGPEVVRDLQALLRAVQIPGPYVLVGHSLGGLLVRVYTQQYPDEVAGLVLLDAPHPAYPQRALALLPPPTEGECAEVRESRHFFAQGIHDPATNPEGINLGILCQQAQAGGSVGTRPLAVISACQH